MAQLITHNSLKRPCLNNIREDAAICIQRWFRGILRETFDRQLLVEEYTSANPNKLTPLRVSSLNLQLDKDVQRIRGQLVEWRDFIRGNRVEALNSLFADCNNIIDFMLRYLDKKRVLTLPMKECSVIENENGTIMAISFSHRYKNTSAWYIDYLLSSPANMWQKFMKKKDFISGAGSALIADAAFQSHRLTRIRKKIGGDNRVAVVLTSLNDPFYEQLGFKSAFGERDHPRHPIRLNRNYSHLLIGKNLRQFLRSYGGRAEM
jgi:hypothetical protein